MESSGRIVDPARRAQASEELVVVSTTSAGCALVAAEKSGVHPEMDHRVVALVPPPAARGQDGRLFEAGEAEQVDVELIAPLLVHRRGWPAARDRDTRA